MLGREDERWRTSVFTSFSNRKTSPRSCSTSAASGEVAVTLEMGGAATSMTLSASSASSSKLAVGLVDAKIIRTSGGRRLRNSSRKNVVSVALARSPMSCCIHLSNWVGLRSPSSSVVNSCWRRRCSEAAVHLMSCSFKTE